jgi:hypothetical protein
MRDIRYSSGLSVLVRAHGAVYLPDQKAVVPRPAAAGACGGG